MGKSQNRPDADKKNFTGFEFYKPQRLNNQNKLNTLAKAIEDFEDFFLTAKKGELFRFSMMAIEKPLIENVLQKAEGNQLRTAKILGMNRNTLHAKIKKLKIDVRDFKDSKGWRR